MSVSRAQPRLVRKLEDALGPAICAALADPSVLEIMLNPDGRLFVERLGEQIIHFGQLPAAAAEVIIGSVAHALQSEVDFSRPIVSGELPIGGHRFEGLLPPIVTAPAFSIRRHASQIIPLEDYVSTGTMSEDQALAITAAVASRSNIVVVGGTGSGKTTLANAIIELVAREAPQHRLVILEDTAELYCSAPNSISLRTSDHIDMARLLKSTMRLRPDRIIVGEVRDGAALTLLKAWNTGHPGGLTTLHANSAIAALRRLEQLTAEVTPQPLRDVIGEAVDVVVSITRTSTGRRVREVLAVEGFSAGQYQTQSLTKQGDRHAV